MYCLKKRMCVSVDRITRQLGVDGQRELSLCIEQWLLMINNK
jgi:hypothetical protein